MLPFSTLTAFVSAVKSLLLPSMLPVSITDSVVKVPMDSSVEVYVISKSSTKLSEKTGLLQPTLPRTTAPIKTTGSTRKVFIAVTS